FQTDKNKSFCRAGTLTANDVAGDLNRRTMSRVNEVDRAPNVWQVFSQEFHGMRSGSQIHGFVIRFHAFWLGHWHKRRFKNLGSARLWRAGERILRSRTF